MASVTVAITNWNYGEYLGQAVSSIKNQIRKADDWFIVDDGSIDPQSQELYSFMRDRVIKHGKQLGAAAAFNTSLAKCKTDFLIMLDADDYLAPSYIQEMLKVIEENKAEWVYCDSILIDRYFSHIKRMNYPDFDLEKLLKGNFISSAAMIRASLLRKVGGYRVCADTLCDWDIWKRIALTGVIAVKCDSTVLYYRQHGFSRMHGGRGIG